MHPTHISLKVREWKTQICMSHHNKGTWPLSKFLKQASSWIQCKIANHEGEGMEFTIGVILLHKQQQQNGAMMLLVFCRVARNYFHAVTRSEIIIIIISNNKNNQGF